MLLPANLQQQIILSRSATDNLNLLFSKVASAWFYSEISGQMIRRTEKVHTVEINMKLKLGTLTSTKIYSIYYFTHSPTGSLLS